MFPVTLTLPVPILDDKRKQLFHDGSRYHIETSTTKYLDHYSNIFLCDLHFPAKSIDIASYAMTLHLDFVGKMQIQFLEN